jgi:hypothetical protein
MPEKQQARSMPNPHRSLDGRPYQKLDPGQQSRTSVSDRALGSKTATYGTMALRPVGQDAQAGKALP